ncbi:hypothetical protein CRUP_010279 [Coryphaenoides rupestris]|nr:hypothetical protein CRUP_010279 [Coryphaenoides rupestris]
MLSQGELSDRRAHRGTSEEEEKRRVPPLECVGPKHSDSGEQMATVASPPLVARKPSGVRVMIAPEDQRPVDGFAMYTRPFSQEDLLTMKASPPGEEEFVAIFQKIKYSFSLLLVKTTGGPDLGASVVSPALTNGAVSLLQEHLTQEEKSLWTTLGHNWTSPSSQLGMSVPPYTPVFLDGWEPKGPDGQPWEDLVEAQHRQDASRASRMATEDPASATSERPASGVQQSDEYDGSTLPPEGDRMYSCSYDFVARNSSELSVLQGETLEVVESSKRWWKCRNRFDQIGFVPFNILEPLSALGNHAENDPLARSESKKVPLASPTNKYFSYAPHSPGATSPRPTSTMAGEDGGKGGGLARRQGIQPRDVHNATELEAVMEKQKLKVDLKAAIEML